MAYIFRVGNWLHNEGIVGSRDSVLFCKGSKLSLRSTQAHTGQLLVIISSAVKRLTREADHSIRHTAQMKNEWNYTPDTLHHFVTCTEAIFHTIRLTLGCGSRHSINRWITYLIHQPLVHPGDLKNCTKQYVVLLCVGNNGGYFISTTQLQMYPVVEIGGPTDKKTPRIILKAPQFSRFWRGSWGREYWVFFVRYLCQQLNPRVWKLCRIMHKYMS